MVYDAQVQYSGRGLPSLGRRKTVCGDSYEPMEYRDIGTKSANMRVT